MSGLKRIVFILIAVAICAGYLWYANREIIPKTVTWQDVLADAKNGNYRIISTDELWNRYKQDSEIILLVDTRQEWEYRTGHIKCAINFPIEPTWLSRWRNKGALQKLLGPDTSRMIVFY
jgi:hypothetical protein